MRSLPIWKYFAQYYPIKLHKTQNLEPTFTEKEVLVYHKQWSWPLSKIFNKGHGLDEEKCKIQSKTGPTYLFGYHPHGAVSMGVMGAFGSEGANWSKLYPGIPVSAMTLVKQFQVPIYRDYLLSLGISSVARLNALELLRRGQSITIVVGGAQESLMAHPSSTKLVLIRRKGFIKLAMEVGNVCLVPVYAFGENEIYDTVPTESQSFVRRYQIFLKKKLQFTIPLFHARGVFNYDFGLMPYRRPIDIVMGRPISVPFLPTPKPEEVEKYHDLYVEELKRVFNANKHKYYKKYSPNGEVVKLTAEELDKVELDLVE